MVASLTLINKHRSALWTFQEAPNTSNLLVALGWIMPMHTESEYLLTSALPSSSPGWDTTYQFCQVRLEKCLTDGVSVTAGMEHCKREENKLLPVCLYPSPYQTLEPSQDFMHASGTGSRPLCACDVAELLLRLALYQITGYIHFVIFPGGATSKQALISSCI